MCSSLPNILEYQSRPRPEALLVAPETGPKHLLQDRGIEIQARLKRKHDLSLPESQEEGARTQDTCGPTHWGAWGSSC